MWTRTATRTFQLSRASGTASGSQYANSELLKRFLQSSASSNQQAAQAQFHVEEIKVHTVDILDLFFLHRVLFWMQCTRQNIKTIEKKAKQKLKIKCFTLY